MGLVFNPDRCGLPSIPEIDKDDFNFISDCLVPPAPPPIHDCPDLPWDIPIPFPDIPDIPGFPLLNTSFDISASLITLPLFVSSASLTLEKLDKFPFDDRLGTLYNFKFALPKIATWRSGIGPPPALLGTDGDYYLNLGDGSPLNIGNGDIYRKINGIWTGPIGNIKGADGALTTMPCCPQTNYTSIVTGVYCQGNVLMVQYQS